MLDPDLAAILDNVGWHALRGPQAHFARASSDGRAVRFDPEVTVFGAVERFDDDSWRALRELLGDQHLVMKAKAVPSAPDGAEITFDMGLVQMVAPMPIGVPPGLELVALGVDDVEEMLELVGLTHPGPFTPRTPELGSYVGVRRDGQLIAMAGERMKPPGAVEISAVCTHPDHQRQGLGAALTAHMAEQIRARDQLPFLHVTTTNETARRVYRALGFEERAEFAIFGVRFSG